MQQPRRRQLMWLQQQPYIIITIFAGVKAGRFSARERYFAIALGGASESQKATEMPCVKRQKTQLQPE